MISNSVLTYTSQPDSPTSTDPVTGAPVFDSSPITVACSLEESETTGDRQEIPGVDRTSIFLTGRCKSPKTLPDEMKPNRFYSIAFDSGQQTLTGKFYMLPTVKSRLGLDSVFGDPISGYLVFG